MNQTILLPSTIGSPRTLHRPRSPRRPGALLLALAALGSACAPADNAPGTWIESVAVSKTKLDVGDAIEFDFRVFITPGDRDADIEAITLTFPDGHDVRFEREVRPLSTDHEHDVGFWSDPEMGSAWLYQNIGLANLDGYPNGEYRFIVHHSGGSTRPLSVPFCDPEGDPDWVAPPLPTIVGPVPGVLLKGGAEIEIEPLPLEAAVFVGRRPRAGEAAGDFAETRDLTIPAGETSTGFLELSRGFWGGDIGVGFECAGSVDGVEWEMTVSSATEVDLAIAGGGSRIVFQSERDGNMEIYLMNADGSEPKRLTDHPADDIYPSWSPLGDRIAFVSNRDGDGGEGGEEIYLIDPDGSDLTRLTNNDVTDSSPRWTPDGKRIVFHSTTETGRASFIMNADGSDVHRIIPDDWVAISPSVSPDGERVVVERDAGNEWNFGDNESARRAQIWIVDLDGSGARQITDIDAYNGFPAWSPDGTRIVFDSNPSPGSPPADLWVVKPDGSGLVNLTRSPGYNEFAAWSPDGGRIAFVSSRDGDEEIYVMNADGSEPTRLTHSPGSDWVPSWSPD